MVIKTAALIEQKRIGRVYVLCCVARIHGPATEGNAAPLRIPDRIHDPVAEGIIGFAPLVGGARQSAFKNQVFRHALIAQMIPKALPAILGKADIPSLERRPGQRAARQIITRGRPCPTSKVQAEMAHRHFHHVRQFGPPVPLFFGPGVLGRHFEARHRCQRLDRLHE